MDWATRIDWWYHGNVELRTYGNRERFQYHSKCSRLLNTMSIVKMPVHSIATCDVYVFFWFICFSCFSYFVVHKYFVLFPFSNLVFFFFYKFGSTCHGAGRAFSRAKSRRTLNYQAVLNKLKAKNISIRVASPKLVMEEAPESYKDVEEVVNTCHSAGISKKSFKLRPVAVVKG